MTQTLTIQSGPPGDHTQIGRCDLDALPVTETVDGVEIAIDHSTALADALAISLEDRQLARERPDGGEVYEIASETFDPVALDRLPATFEAAGIGRKMTVTLRLDD